MILSFEISLRFQDSCLRLFSFLSYFVSEQLKQIMLMMVCCSPPPHFMNILAEELPRNVDISELDVLTFPLENFHAVLRDFPYESLLHLLDNSVTFLWKHFRFTFSALITTWEKPAQNDVSWRRPIYDWGKSKQKCHASFHVFCIAAFDANFKNTVKSFGSQITSISKWNLFFNIFYFNHLRLRHEVVNFTQFPFMDS